MLSKLSEVWSDIKNSLWFIPSVMGITATIAAFLLIELDGNVGYKELPFKWFLYSGNKEGARSVLSTIASSMATIAGVTFSMTLVALTMASSQFGPRLLRNFITDKGNQLVLGTFISTFIYSLIVLLAIREGEDEAFIPKISVIVAFAFSICSLGVLIYFIHHIASSIQAELVIESSFRDLENAISRFMRDEKSSSNRTSAGETHYDNLKAQRAEREVISDRSGYLQLVHHARMCDWAQKNDVVVKLLKHAGDFCTIQEPIALLLAQPDLVNGCERKLLEFMVIRSSRTPEQEINFPIRQIVEVAVRALSPGINDPHTAISCIKWLGAALSMIGSKHLPPWQRADATGTVRVLMKPYSYSDIVDTCFDQLGIYARTNIFVTLEMLIAIKTAISQAKHAELLTALETKASTIMSQLHGQRIAVSELQKAKQIYRELMQVYEMKKKG